MAVQVARLVLVAPPGRAVYDTRKQAGKPDAAGTYGQTFRPGNHGSPTNLAAGLTGWDQAQVVGWGVIRPPEYGVHWHA